RREWRRRICRDRSAPTRESGGGEVEGAQGSLKRRARQHECETITMALPAGTRFGPYEVVAPLGAGAMGEVYRARDTTLDRDVALKILPTTFALSPDRVSRFQREARVLAALNHPHIGTIFGIAESNGVRALVLELVEGQTLADRIARGPMAVAEARHVARQICEALGAAHRRGIVHRD